MLTDKDEQMLRTIIQRQEEAITELNERIRARDAIMEGAVKEAHDLHQHLNELYLRMVRSRWTRP